jgi:hypothetical protein
MRPAHRFRSSITSLMTGAFPMADDTTADKPLAPLADAERNLNTETDAEKARAEQERTKPFMTTTEPVSDEPASPVDRLRAFEDEKLGKDTPRQQGMIERGVGSHFSRMSDEDKAMHAKIEKLIETEGKLSAAHTALLTADAEHDAALKAVDG